MTDFAESIERPGMHFALGGKLMLGDFDRQLRNHALPEKRSQAWTSVKEEISARIEVFQSRGEDQSPDDLVSYSHEAQSLTHCLDQIDRVIGRQESLAVAIHNRPFRQEERRSEIGSNLTSYQEILQICKGKEISVEKATKKNYLGPESIYFRHLLRRPEGISIAQIVNPSTQSYPTESFFDSNGAHYRTRFMVLKKLPGTAIISLETRAAGGTTCVPVKAHFLSF